MYVLIVRLFSLLPAPARRDIGNVVTPATCAPTSLHSKGKSWYIDTPTVEMFLDSVERRFRVPAKRIEAVVRSLGQPHTKRIASFHHQRGRHRLCCCRVVGVHIVRFAQVLQQGRSAIDPAIQPRQGRLEGVSRRRL
jgi:hypothetical protein